MMDRCLELLQGREGAPAPASISDLRKGKVASESILVTLGLISVNRINGLNYRRLISSLQALQKSFPFPDTVKHSSGKSFTLSLGVTDLGSLEPCPLDLFLPTGGLQSTFLFLVRSDACGVFKTSRIDLELVGLSPSIDSVTPIHFTRGAVVYFYLEPLCACAFIQPRRLFKSCTVLPIIIPE